MNTFLIWEVVWDIILAPVSQVHTKQYCKSSASILSFVKVKDTELGPFVRSKVDS